jgi:hypothetical protein
MELIIISKCKKSLNVDWEVERIPQDFAGSIP